MNQEVHIYIFLISFPNLGLRGYFLSPFALWNPLKFIIDGKNAMCHALELPGILTKDYARKFQLLTQIKTLTLLLKMWLNEELLPLDFSHWLTGRPKRVIFPLRKLIF